MNYFINKWKDPVWSKVIAAGIIYILTLVINTFTQVFNKGIFLLTNFQISRVHIYIGLTLVVFVIISIILIYFNIARSKIQVSYHNQYYSLTGKKLEIDFVSTKSPDIKYISICGRANVGKTTLIENICGEENKFEVTEGKGVYVLNLSNKSYNYCAILDGSGQSQAIQNDLATLASTIIIMVDHNFKDQKINIVKSRINDHKIFINLLIDRLYNSNTKISNIIVLLNKSDLWIQSNREKQQVLLDAGSEIQTLLSENFKNSKIEVLQFSNESQKNIKNLKHKLNKLNL